MDNTMFWVVFLLAAIVFYRLLSRREVTPKAKVTAMLRRYRALERSGLSEQDCLLQLLTTRKEWTNFSHRFLAGIVSRLRSKEDVMRFVTLSEDYGYHHDPYPQLSRKIDLDGAMTEIACLFSRFGYRLQNEGRYKEAEFVQKLALRLQPDEYFTNLPLAATYHETGRHADAVPLFKEGLARLERFEADGPEYSPAKCLAADAELAQLRKLYSKMYQACLKAAGNKTLSGSAFLMELFG